MNLDFASSDEVGFWGEIESSLDVGGKKACQNELATQQISPGFFETGVARSE
jgi:hypothetical protein